MNITMKFTIVINIAITIIALICLNAIDAVPVLTRRDSLHDSLPLEFTKNLIQANILADNNQNVGAIASQKTINK
jgi:hypothetical protein